MWPGVGWVELLIGGFIMFLLLGGVIALAFLVIRALSRSGPTRAGGEPFSRAEETPLEILKKRYARGEISREEYLDMKRELET